MKVIAHRGASAQAPENTLLAIETALNLKVDAVEIDIHLVEDQLVVIHDRWLHKTTNGQGRLKDITFAQLRSLDAGKGQLVPTLWEVLNLVRGRCELNVELKSERTVEPLLSMLHKAIEQLGFSQSQFIISSFNHHLLQEIKQTDKTWRIGALTGSRPLGFARFAEELDAYSINIDVDFVDPLFVDDAHGRGLKVFVYTVDHEEDIEDLLAIGVDGIFTNDPTRSMVKLAHMNLKI